MFFFSGRHVCTKTSINKDGTFGGLWKRTFKAAFSLACERKESLQLHLWNLNIGINKIYAKFCLAEMTFVMTSLPFGTCFSMFVYTRARFRFALIGKNMAAQSTGSHVGIGGGIQIPEM